MLQHLCIRNLAVIEAIDIDFESGFNVLSGETGAGKSILVEAIGLLLGGRATQDLVRTGESQVTLEAVFENAHQGQVTVRREITAGGRSRAFVGGKAVTAAALREAAGQHVELYGQHEHHALLDPLNHLLMLDDYAQLNKLSGQVANYWSNVKAIRDRLKRVQMGDREKKARLELIDFQLKEIESVSPLPNEDKDLASKRQILASAERVLSLCHESHNTLYDSDTSVLASLSSVWKNVEELAELDPRFSPYLIAGDEIKSQLEDLSDFLRDYAGQIDASPGQLQLVEERLSSIDRLKSKYSSTLEEVIELCSELKKERLLLTETQEGSEVLEKELKEASNNYLAKAKELSKLRKSGAKHFSLELSKLLAELAIKQARFEVRFTSEELSEDHWSERGLENAEFFFSPNPGEDLRPLARIASGGELSRILLALKSLSGERPSDTTLIFDEVDAGIGGRVADVVGSHLAILGSKFQVLCITHLPQIAAHGSSHFRIDKNVQKGRTITSVTRLDTDQRVQEIARMMGGSLVTKEITASAKVLLTSRGKGAKGEKRTNAKV